MSEKSPNSFFYRPCLPRKRRGRCGLRRQGEFMSCAPACWSVARCICVRRGLHSRGGALERLVARRGPCSNQARQAFLCRGSPRRGGPGINRTRRPGEHRRRAGFCPRSGTRCPAGGPGEAMPFASGSIGQRPALPMSATPKFQSLVRSCATNAGKGATSVAFGADVCGVHVRP